MLWQLVLEIGTYSFITTVVWLYSENVWYHFLVSRRLFQDLLILYQPRMPFGFTQNGAGLTCVVTEVSRKWRELFLNEANSSWFSAELCLCISNAAWNVDGDMHVGYILLMNSEIRLCGYRVKYVQQHDAGGFLTIDQCLGRTPDING